LTGSACARDSAPAIRPVKIANMIAGCFTSSVPLSLSLSLSLS
jgi:hypothetical protein